MGWRGWRRRTTDQSIEEEAWSTPQPYPWSAPVEARWNEGQAVVTLTLDESGLDLHTSAAARPDIYIDRFGVGALVKDVADWDQVAGTILIGDPDGEVLSEFRERWVRISKLPAGIDRDVVPLGVVLGTWWPHPDARFVRVQPTKRRSRARLYRWNLPELDNFKDSWARRRKLAPALVLAAQSLLCAALFVIAIQLTSSMQVWLASILAIMFGARAIRAFRDTEPLLS